MINGGPNCFGDSGGPLFSVVRAGVRRQVPVLVGVFSFMLWGTCSGREEPGYHGDVEALLRWIEKYVDRDEMCRYGGDGFKPSKYSVS